MEQQLKTVIWGAGGHAVVVANIVELHGFLQVVGFLDDVNPEKKGQVICGKPVMGGRELLGTLRDIDVSHIALGIGNCAARLNLGDIIVKSGFSVPTLIHPSAVIAADSEIDDGTIIHAGAVVAPRCRIGRYSIINHNATIDHDCNIDDGVHICPGVNMAGSVKVGQGSWLGIGTSVVQEIQIGKGSYIGAGSVVVKDIPDGVLVYGNPARVVKPMKSPF